MAANTRQMQPADAKRLQLERLIDKGADALIEVLPDNLTVARLKRIVLQETRVNSDLLNCDPMSVVSSVIRACIFGLEVGSGKGHAYLVPYKVRGTNKKTCQLIIGYKGFVWLAHNSGKIAKVEARAVHQGDTFHYHYGINPDLQHTPLASDRTDADHVTHVYAVAFFNDGTEPQFDVMTYAELMRIRDRSPTSSDETPWGTDTIEMMKKTVIRRLAKLLPLHQMQEASGIDELADTGEQPKMVDFDEYVIEGEAEDVTDKPAETRTDQAKTMMADKEADEAAAAAEAEAAAAEGEADKATDGKPVEEDEMSPMEQWRVMLDEYREANDVQGFIKKVNADKALTADEKKSLIAQARA